MSGDGPKGKSKSINGIGYIKDDLLDDLLIDSGVLIHGCSKKS